MPVNSDDLHPKDAINQRCPWSGNLIAEDSLMLYRGKVVGFCNPGCRDRFAKAMSAFDTLIDGAD